MLQVVTSSFKFPFTHQRVPVTGEPNLMFLVDGSGAMLLVFVLQTDLLVFVLQTDLSQAGVRRWGRRCEGPAVQAIFP